MVDFQIILLPRKDYWDWVRACRDYVMAYGANLTPDPITAANYMAPQQVITFPRVKGSHAEISDLETWFLKNHPGVRLDVIEAATPQELSTELGLRVEEEDRYGQRRRPFYLLWPTDYPVITQRFGANPQIYTRFGMPGHEGLDIRALPDSSVYCCADGIVYRVNRHPSAHAYGIHVRIQHKDGFKTVYGHLAQAFVEEGQHVRAGEVLGKADSTGASTASHLHLTLKQDGASMRKETKYPKDVIDPTPYMVWPEASLRKAARPPAWPAERALVGGHLRAGGSLRDEDFELVEAAQLEAVKIELGKNQEAVVKLRRLNPGLFIMVRLGLDFSSGAVSADDFLQRQESELGELYAAGVRYFEVHANPNLHIEGWNRSWQTGKEFAAWFEAVVVALRSWHEDLKLGFPGLSPGGHVSGWRADANQFLSEAESAIALADWVGVNCYWSDRGEMLSLTGGRRYDYYRQQFPDKLLFVTEFNNASAEVDRMSKARQYVEYYRLLRDVSGLAAVFAFPLTAERGYESVCWMLPGEGHSDIASAVGNRGF